MTAPVFDPLMAYPSYDAPFLTTWDGVFEAVFVAFHPFARVKGRNPFAEGRTIIPEGDTSAASFSGDGAVDGILKTLEADSRLLYAGSAVSPDEIDDPADLQAVTWKEVAERAGLTGGAAELCEVQLSLIGAIRPQHEIKRDAFVAFARREGLFLPSEGQMQPLLLPALRRWFESLGHAEVVVQPEFDDGQIVPVAKVEGWSDRVSFYDQGKTALAVVDWDSFFTLVAGPRRALEDWVRTENLDGFFADKTTGHGWWHAAAKASENTRS